MFNSFMYTKPISKFFVELMVVRGLNLILENSLIMYQNSKAMCSVILESNIQNCNHDYDTTDGHDYNDDSDTDDDVYYDESNNVHHELRYS